MRVCVASKNPVKIQAVKEAFKEFFEKEVEVFGIKVSSEVSAQPWNEETWKGALNRVKNARKSCKADFYVGIEAGIFEALGRFFVANCIVIEDTEGNKFMGMSPWFELSKELAEQVKKSREMEEVIEKITGVKEIGEKEGAIGIFTKGRMTRKDLTKHGVLAALAGYYQAKLLKPR